MLLTNKRRKLPDTANSNQGTNMDNTFIDAEQISSATSLHDLPFYFIKEIFGSVNLSRLWLFTLHDNQLILSIALSILFNIIYSTSLINVNRFVYGESLEQKPSREKCLRINLSSSHLFQSQVINYSTAFYLNLKDINNELRHLKQLQLLKGKLKTMNVSYNRFIAYPDQLQSILNEFVLELPDTLSNIRSRGENHPLYYWDEDNWK